MHGAERRGRHGHRVGTGEAGAGEGPDGDNAVIAGRGGVLVGPAFDGESDGGGGGSQQRVGGGGEVGELGSYSETARLILSKLG